MRLRGFLSYGSWPGFLMVMAVCVFQEVKQDYCHNKAGQETPVAATQVIKPLYGK